jgi:hypothetical protein
MIPFAVALGLVYEGPWVEEACTRRSMTHCLLVKGREVLAIIRKRRLAVGMMTHLGLGWVLGLAVTREELVWEAGPLIHSAGSGAEILFDGWCDVGRKR